MFGSVKISTFNPSWTTVPEVCNLKYIFTLTPQPDNPNLIVIDELLPVNTVTVKADLVYYDDGSLTGFYNPGSYKIEVRAWADNNVDTGKFEDLDIEVIDACSASIPFVTPDSPLELQTYFLGSIATQYDVQTISEPDIFSFQQIFLVVRR